MRLLNASLKSYLSYSVLIVLIGTPVGFLVIREILQEEVDELLKTKLVEFTSHIKTFEYLDDLEVDLDVMDKLSYDLDIRPDRMYDPKQLYTTVSVYDSIEREIKPYRQLTSGLLVRGQPYALKLRMSLVENDELISVLGIVMAAVIVLLTAGLFFINRALSKAILSPFYNTLQKLKAYELDKGHAFEYDESRIIEFNDLNQALRLLTEKNRLAFEQQKAFIENAAHELQTPLAIFQSKLDLLMQSHDLTEEQAILVKDMMGTNQRIARLNRSLLFISKLENEQFLEKEPVDVDALLREALQNFHFLTDTSAITTTAEIENCTLYSNKYLIEVLLSNLVRNAYQHNIAKGHVAVKLTKQEFVIRNSGDSQALRPGSLFKRFVKGKANSDSTGLGLSIAEKICRLSGFSISYSFVNNEHVFTVSFEGGPIA
jgi:signal transduction histidine kinase